MKLLGIRLKLHTDLSIILNINYFPFSLLHIIESFCRLLYIYILHKHISKFKNLLLEIPRISFLINFQKKRKQRNPLKNESIPPTFQFLTILKIVRTHLKTANAD